MGSTSARAPRTTSTPPPTDAESDRPIDLQLAVADAAPFDITARAAGSVVPITTTVAQQRGAMLALISSPAWTPQPGVAPMAGGDLTTDLTLPLPADGELAVDGRRSGAQLAFGAVIGVRGGAAGYAVQIAEAQGCHGAPRVELRTDPDAKLAHVRITHGDGAHACRPHLVLLIAGGHASTHAELALLMDSAHATVTQRTVELKPEPVKPAPAPSTPPREPVDLTSWSASARIDRGALKGASLSVERREARKADDSGDMPIAFVSRKASGKPMFFGVLDVNGVDMSGVLDSANTDEGAKH
jgi:hypothetical protein